MLTTPDKRTLAEHDDCDVMRARYIIMIASGVKKAGIIKTRLEQVVDQDVSASILTLHPHFTLIVDEEAASLL